VGGAFLLSVRQRDGAKEMMGDSKAVLVTGASRGIGRAKRKRFSMQVRA
jgi:hypothetical protein